MVYPALINSYRYEYACSGLVNISYWNINHSFIGNLSAVEDGNRQARAWGWREEAETYWKGEDGREKLEGVGVKEFERQKIFEFVCVCMRTRLGDREISLQEQACPLALLHSIWGKLHSFGETRAASPPLHRFVSHTFFTRSLQMKTQRAHSSSAICLSWDKSAS